MYQLIKDPEVLSFVRRPANIEYHRIFDTVRETGETHFLHGVAIEQWQGKLAACFAFNMALENSITEQLMITWSEDGGRTWSKPESITEPAPYANSHSVFLPLDDELWCIGPRFMGLGEVPVTKKGRRACHFVSLQTEAWKLSGGKWQPMGIVADGFWPLSAPVKLDNGNWLLSGCSTKWMGAAAISHGDDLTHWDVVLPDTDEEVFTEAGAWTDGNRVFLVLRNGSLQTGDRFHAAVALSEDFGKTFAHCELSNLPMCTTKPFCGRLSDGRPYLVFNQSIDGAPHDRSRMMLGVGEKGSFRIDRVFLIDEGHMTPSGKRLALSYPYAREIEGKLHIVYSYESAPNGGANNNDAVLAIVDIDSLS